MANNGNSQSKHFFPRERIKFVTENRGNGEEERVIITLAENHQPVNVPLAGLQVVKDKQTKEVLGVNVNCCRIRRKIRQAAAIR